jgi:hypothetical protein
MESFNKVNILFYVEPLIELENPYFKKDWINYLVNSFIKTLKSKQYNFMIITNEAILEECDKLLKVEYQAISQKELFKPFDITAYQDITKIWYHKSYNNEQLLKYKTLLKNKLDNFIPNIIITFTPIPFLESLYPKSLILHHEYSILSRKPFPQTWFLDPVGVVSDSFLNKYIDTINKNILTKKQDQFLKKYKDNAKQALLENNPFKEFLSKKRDYFEYLILLPLQFSGYYLFDEQAQFKSQYEYCVYVLDNTPINIGVVVNMHPAHPSLNDDAIKFLSKQYAHFIYSEIFSNIDNSAQYILPFIDAVVTVSSSTALVSTLLDKKIITLGETCFNYVSDAKSLDNIASTLSKPSNNKDNFIYFILTKYAISEKYLYDSKWLNNFLNNSIKREIDINFYDCIDTDENLLNNLNDTLHKNKLETPQYKNNFIQLYINISEEFSESSSIRMLFFDKNNIIFNLSKYKNIKSLRFDPIDNYCILKINNVLLDNRHICIIYTNAFFTDNDIYYFDTNDPQVYFEEINEKNKNELKIDIEYISIGNDARNQFPDTYKEILEEKSQKIKDLNEKVIFLALNNSAMALNPLKIFNWYLIIQKSNFFDENYYNDTYLDIKKNKINPILHYIRFGAKEGRNPNDSFNTIYYLTEYEDVAISKLNPLVHYIKYGESENRKISINKTINKKRMTNQ